MERCAAPRNPGLIAPDFASLNPGYGFFCCIAPKCAAMTRNETSLQAIKIKRN
jgi:hypothetical protein